MITHAEEKAYAMWERLKREGGVETTEEIFDIDIPPEHQCPKIDKVIKTINEVNKQANVGRHDEFEDLKDKLKSIEYDISGLDDDVEELREAIESVRKWGQQWKELAKKVIA
ncbi:hypothetical protein [Bacillus sp. T33-2]|uniref:hypothetical protein n=1 Tax=Bacillus sp. T33-2 TaxID=2054168 RepID=UPI000C75C494|nr:hypothetical protein [Bacillus sp. T33-2]PLR99542.1 hypothetical protein CVD19_00330 [Bacillus sp. T33-2]